MVGGAVRADEGRGVVEGEAARQRHDEIGIHAGVRGEAAHAAERRDGVADLELRHAVAHRVHHAGVFRARHERQRRLHLVLVLHDQQVGKVEAGRADGDPHFARLRLRRGQFLPRQGFGADRVVADPGMHGVISIRTSAA
jgi:hypothetical protein